MTEADDIMKGHDMTVEKELKERIDILELESLQLSKVLIMGAILAAVLVTSITIFSKWGHIPVLEITKLEHHKGTSNGKKNGNAKAE